MNKIIFQQVQDYLSILVKKKSFYLIFFFLLIISLIADYDLETETIIVLGYLDFTQFLPPFFNRTEAFVYLFDDLFKYFWFASIFMIIYPGINILADSFSISNRLWIKFTPLLERDIYYSRILKTFSLAGFLLLLGITWVIIFSIRYGIFDFGLFLPVFGLSTHMLLSSAFLMFFQPSPSTDRRSIIGLVLLATAIPIISGFTLYRLSESLNGWTPYCIWGLVGVSDFPSYRPYLSAAILSFGLFSYRFWLNRR